MELSDSEEFKSADGSNDDDYIYDEEEDHGTVVILPYAMQKANSKASAKSSATDSNEEETKQAEQTEKQIESKTTVKKSSVSFKTITNVIFDHFENVNDAKKLLDKINNNRTESTTSRLRIGKGGKTKNTSQNLSNIINNSMDFCRILIYII